MAPTPSTFHHFPDLPPEIRTLIWHHALQEHDKPALYTYIEGCWDPRSAPTPNKPTTIEFQHEKLIPVEVKIPIAHVSQEARDIAASWAVKRGIKRYFVPHKECHVFARAFDPTRDILYISDDFMFEFNDDAEDRCLAPDLSGCAVSVFADVHRLALPAETIDTDECERYTEDAWYLLPMKGLKALKRLREVCFVLGPQPEYVGPAMEIVEPGWDFEEVDKRELGLAWDVSRGRFDIAEDVHPARREFYERVEVACQWVSEELVKHCESDRVEARPVFVVQS